MQHETHARRLIDEADRRDRGVFQHALLVEAARVAVAAGSEELEYCARLRLAAAAGMSARSTELLDNIEWCLERHLTDSERFAARSGPVELAAVFAAVPPTLAASPSFSLATIDQSLSELQQLLAERDLRDEPDEPDERALSTHPPDSSGAATTRLDSDFLLTRARRHVLEATGRHREAASQRTALSRLRLLRTAAGDESHPAGHAHADADTPTHHDDPAHADDPTHHDDARGDGAADHPPPPRRIAESLLPLLQRGQLSDARLAHLRGYELVRHDPRHLAEIAMHIEYCADIGDLTRGLQLVGRHLHWLVVDPHDELARFDALLAVGCLLDLVCESDAEGHGPDVRVGAAEHPGLRLLLGMPTGAVTAESLSDACWALARTVAQRFDDRNGSSTFLDRCAAAEARSDVRCAALAETDARQGTRAVTHETPAAFRTIDPHSMLPSIQWLRAARERASVADPAGALWAIQQAHDMLDRESSAELLPHDDSARSLARAKPRPLVNSAPANPGPSNKPRARGAAARRKTTPAFDDLVTGATVSPVAPPHSTPGRRTPAPGDRALRTLARPGPADGTPAPPDPARGVRVALYDLEVRLAIERGDLARAEKVAAWRVDQLIAEDRLDLAEVELELGLLLFGVEPERRRGDLERELTAARRGAVDPEAQVSVLNALGELRLKQQRPREAIEFLLSSVTLCGHDPDCVAVQRPLMLLSRAQVAIEQPVWARATLDRLLRHDLDRAMRADALLLRASLLLGADEARAALDDADRALSLSLELHDGAGTIAACANLASLLEHLKVRPGVVEAWRMAVTEATTGFDHGAADHPDLLGLRFRLARALIASERGSEAAAELHRILDAAPTDVPAERAELLFWLGHAYRLEDDDDAAYASWSLSLTLCSLARDARAAVRAGLALGRLLLERDDPDSLDVLEHTLAQARRIPDEPSAEVDALHLYGIAQCAFGDVEGLQTFDRALDRAAQYSFDIDALLATVTESRARALDNLGLDEDALVTAARAARLYERLSDRASAGHAHLFTARLLVTLGRFDEALPVYRRALDLLPLETPVVELAVAEFRAIGARVAPPAGAAAAVTP
ncbi:tetratricopeptide repeat protein [Subtercola boreus]|uniref:Uncharacterized protein n=1 Tax=Subtercola boreus TaxID=120213 RepID=A0A3E0WE23_9MICO|nr:tetratricopeptide repeat protein [Subtercola boreus]RFA23486.1 hypothetical protein B7R24_00925 [Subtercola boreus]RFA23879.1 hypothetical protein B7R23_00925 [Subtercola boreus]RFA29580.1 hypothetical protein B7R25_00920 [Subtercola boreus]